MFHFGYPVAGADKFASLIADTYPDIEAMVGSVELKNGVALVPLTQVMHAGAPIDLLVVRIAPGAKVGAHIHERGGEIEFPLTPVLSVMGDVRKNADGSYMLDDAGAIEHTITEQKIIMPGVPSPIPEGRVHEYRNPMSDAYADIMFFIPHTHATTEDKKLAVSPEISQADLQKLIDELPQK